MTNQVRFPRSFTKRRKIGAPFYPITWNQAQRDFNDGLLTPRGLIFAYFAIHLNPGEETVIDVGQLCRTLGVHEATYYRAIGSLKAAGRLEIRRGSMVVAMPNDSQQSENDSQQSENDSQQSENDSHNCESFSQVRENGTNVKPVQRIASEDFANVPNRSRKYLKEQETADPSIDKGDFGTDILIAKIEESGVIVNKTIRKTLLTIAAQNDAAAAARIVENALSALVEQRRQTAVPNPGGFLVSALRGTYTANKAKRAARDKAATAGATRKPTAASIAATVDAALIAGDRPLAIERLNALWADGWEEEVEDICLLRKREWRFSITAKGVSDGR